MMEFYKPLDFSQIVGAPHNFPNDAIKKLPKFEGNNAITAKSHLRKFESTWSVFAMMLPMTMMMSK